MLLYFPALPEMQSLAQASTPIMRKLGPTTRLDFRAAWFVLPLVSLLFNGCVDTRDPAHEPTERTTSTLSGRQGTWPGRKPDGSVLLPNQWWLRPVGRQVPLTDFPVNVAVHPDGRFAAVLHSGYSDHEIQVVNLASAKVVFRVKVHESFYGLEFSADGRKLFCSGAGDEVVHAFDFKDGTLANHQEIELRPIKDRGVPAGLVLDRATKRLFV